MNAAEMLIFDEGERLKVYPDSKGHPSIGVGRCLDLHGITQQESRYLFANDLSEAIGLCTMKLVWYPVLPEARRAVLVNMMFNLGWGKLSLFVHFLEAMRQLDYHRAAAEMRNSEWAKELPKRVERLAKQMETGEWQPLV